MRSTFKVLFYLKRNKDKDQKVVPVMGRITVNGSIAQFSAKLSVPEMLWRGRLLLSGLRAVFVGAIRPALFIRRLLPGAIRPAPFIRHYPPGIPFKPHFFSVANERICQVTPTATASSAACAHHHPESGAKTQ